MMNKPLFPRTSNFLGAVIITAICLYQFYIAWTRHLVVAPSGFTRHARYLSLADGPYEFWLMLAIPLLLAIALWLIALGLFPRKRQDRPPLEPR